MASEHAFEMERINRNLEQWQKKYNETNARIDLERRSGQRLQAEIAELKDQLTQAQNRQSSSVQEKNTEISRLNEDLAAIEEQRLKLQEREEMQRSELEQKQAMLADLDNKLVELQQKHQLVKQELQQTSRDQERCLKHNKEMAQAAGELLTRVKNRKIWDHIKQSEPLTGLGQIELEHVVQEYGFRIDDNRIK